MSNNKRPREALAAEEEEQSKTLKNKRQREALAAARRKEEEEEEEVCRLEQEVVHLASSLKKVRTEGSAELRLLVQESLKNKRPHVRSIIASNEAEAKAQGSLAATEVCSKTENFEESLGQIRFLRNRLCELISMLPDLLLRINSCTNKLDKRIKKMGQRKKLLLAFAEDHFDSGALKDDDWLHSLAQIKDELGFEQKKQRVEAALRDAQSRHT